MEQLKKALPLGGKTSRECECEHGASSEHAAFPLPPQRSLLSQSASAIAAAFVQACRKIHLEKIVDGTAEAADEEGEEEEEGSEAEADEEDAEEDGGSKDGADDEKEDDAEQKECEDEYEEEGEDTEALDQLGDAIGDTSDEEDGTDDDAEDRDANEDANDEEHDPHSSLTPATVALLASACPSLESLDLSEVDSLPRPWSSRSKGKLKGAVPLRELPTCHISPSQSPRTATVVLRPLWN